MLRPLADLRAEARAVMAESDEPAMQALGLAALAWADGEELERIADWLDMTGAASEAAQTRAQGRMAKALYRSVRGNEK